MKRDKVERFNIEESMFYSIMLDKLKSILQHINNYYCQLVRF